MAKWICCECSEAESCGDIICKLETPTPDRPDYCPITGEENPNWIEDK